LSLSARERITSQFGIPSSGHLRFDPIPRNPRISGASPPVSQNRLEPNLTQIWAPNWEVILSRALSGRSASIFGAAVYVLILLLSLSGTAHPAKALVKVGAYALFLFLPALMPSVLSTESRLKGAVIVWMIAGLVTTVIGIAGIFVFYADPQGL